MYFYFDSDIISEGHLGDSTEVQRLPEFLPIHMFCYARVVRPSALACLEC